MCFSYIQKNENFIYKENSLTGHANLAREKMNTLCRINY